MWLDMSESPHCDYILLLIIIIIVKLVDTQSNCKHPKDTPQPPKELTKTLIKIRKILLEGKKTSKRFFDFQMNFAKFKISFLKTIKRPAGSLLVH